MISCGIPHTNVLSLSFCKGVEAQDIYVSQGTVLLKSKY